jgi:uncharacterized protein (DUF1015 family)
MFSPFSGWLYQPAASTEPGQVTSPPYDVISGPEREDLLARSPYNIVRLLLPGTTPASYESAAALLREWREDGILARDDAPRFYLYEMDYTDKVGAQRRAVGVIGALELRPLGVDVVPHEETQHKHRADRLALLDSTGANFDPIIALSPARDLGDLLVPSGVSRLDFREPDGSRHRLYDVTEPGHVAAIERSVAAHPVAIADGHHRYTTSLGYRETRDASHGPGPWDAIMAFVAPAEGSGLTIGPYHRVLRPFDFDPGLVAPAFGVTEAPPAAPDAPGSLVIVAGDATYRLDPRPEALEDLPEPWRAASAAVARELLYPLLGVDEEGADYAADAEEAVSAAASGRGVALLVAPVTEEAVGAAGERGLRFPTKSTYFTPKPRAGLVMRCFEP